MNLQDWQQRLSSISTQWTQVRQAHGGPGGAAKEALLERYLGAAYRYLLGALRDEEAAVELLQEFALRFFRGDFHRVEAGRGRFRAYLKTVLINLVNDHRAAQRGQARPLPLDCAAPAAACPPDEEDRHFLDSWREELVSRTWAVVAETQPIFFAVLVAHVQQPELPSPQLAEHLTGQFGKPFSPGNVRVLLHRARNKFADLLLEEVAQSLEGPTADELQEELRTLNLLHLCRSALERRHQP